MPILAAEPDCHPSNLLSICTGDESVGWWLVYTNSRQEKKLMRLLRDADIAHYAPQVKKRYRSPAGRIRTSFQPLFSNYVFLHGTNEDRFRAVSTGCVQKATEVTDTETFVTELKQIYDLIAMDVPLTIETKIESGQPVRVKNGAFQGYEGIVLKRMGETRLLVSVKFMEQAISVKLDDCQLEPLGPPPEQSTGCE